MKLIESKFGFGFELLSSFLDALALHSHSSLRPTSYLERRGRRGYE